ncbi:MAG: cupin domain-containing protein [Acidobacteriota bacterium]
MDKINLEQKFGLFSEQWSPKIVGELNGQQVRLAKLQGPFVWHHHDAEDELFMVIKGRLRIERHDADGGNVELDEGEMLIVPRGVEHRPVADDEVWLMMFEPASTLNTGNAGGNRTVAEPERI